MTEPIEPLGDWIELAPWKSREVLLIDMFTMKQAWRVTEKRALLDREANPRGLVLAIWPGQWSTSARYFLQGDHERVLDVLG